jgi:DNA-binding transcriptional MerR regulator
MQELRDLRDLLETQRPGAWEALPDIALYMDQVVSYLRRQTIGADEDSNAPMTSAMINNYIKDGLLPRANGKRYSREHLVYLTAIALLKNVLSVKDMKLLLGIEITPGNEPEFYGAFLRRVDTSFRDVAESIDPDIQEDELANFALDLAVVSSATKIACEHVLSILREKEAPAEKEKKEK